MAETKTLVSMDIKELKSLAYDEMVKLETAQNNLRILNIEINSRSRKDEHKE